ncbi:hypothetical protein FQA39_LY17464 [Lamprigera yunnana]|nr:hypothetical protein FQA39_LY17464 [Lamprigera yunnana]
MEDAVAIAKLQKYIQIPTVHPNIDYEPIRYLQLLAKDLDIPLQVYNYMKNRVAVFTWVGQEPTVSSVLLNSHMDTVPDLWKYNPFEGKIDDKGNIYGHGARDCKSLGIMYLEAIRRLKKSGV